MEELRKVEELQGNTYSSYEILGMVKHARIEIERLRAEIEGAEDFIPRKFAGLREQNERLREALNEIRGCKDWYTATKIACDALEQKGPAGEKGQVGWMGGEWDR